MRRGDPCNRRFKVMKDGWRSPHRCRWRVFELAQPGQVISNAGDMYYDEWADAMAYADLCAQEARRECQRREE